MRHIQKMEHVRKILILHFHFWFSFKLCMAKELAKEYNAVENTPIKNPISHAHRQVRKRKYTAFQMKRMKDVRGVADTSFPNGNSKYKSASFLKNQCSHENPYREFIRASSYEKCLRAFPDSEGPDYLCFRAGNQDLLCPLTASLDTSKCMTGE